MKVSKLILYRTGAVYLRAGSLICKDKVCIKYLKGDRL